MTVENIEILEENKFLSPEEALTKVIAGDGSTRASADVLFENGFFGRDAMEVSQDLIEKYPDIVRSNLIALAQLQGTCFNRKNEEVPGKIPHEHREGSLDGKPLDDIQQLIFDELSERWGGNRDSMTYYGSIDSTPLFISVLCEYTRIYDRTFLDYTIVTKDGEAVTMGESLNRALNWLVTGLELSRYGLLEYKALTKNGIENQAWKDSHEFYIHEDGSMVNHEKPVASIEVQGLAYDALVAAAEVMPQLSQELIARAYKLRDDTLRTMWIPEYNYFALGTDYDEDRNIRQIRTRTANPAELLDTHFFDDLAEEDKVKYISAIVETIASSDFLTNGGIRSRSIEHNGLVKYWDYHGSNTTWPKETYDISKGLRRQGFPGLADQLDNRLINALTRTGSYPEFLYVDEEGHILTDYFKTQAHADFLVMTVEGSNNPESWQAWTIAAAIAITETLKTIDAKGRIIQDRNSWKTELEQKIMAEIKNIPILNGLELYECYPDKKYTVDRSNAITAPKPMVFQDKIAA